MSEAAEPAGVEPDAGDRQVWAAMVLAGDIDACEALARGIAVPTHRLNHELVEKLGLVGEVTMSDALALRVELARPTTNGAHPMGEEIEEPLFLDAYDFINLQVDPPVPLWGSEQATLLPAGGLCLFTGRPGVGKTTFVLDLACHLAAGVDAYGFEVPRPLRVALIENEGPIAMFQDKLKDKLRVWPHDIREAGGWLGIQTWRWGSFSFADEDAFYYARAELENLEVDVVIGDPLAMLGMEGVGSPAETRAFVQIIRRLGLGHGRAFLFLHHFRERVDKNEDELAKISGAWGGHLDTLLTLAPMGREDEARLAFPKLRWGKGRPPKPLILGRVYNTQSYEVLGEEGDATILEPAIVDHLDGLRKAGLGYGNKGWRTATQIAAKEEGLGRKRGDVESALKGAPHLFVTRVGADARALGAKAPNAVLYGLAAWADGPVDTQPTLDEAGPAPQEDFPF